VCVWNSNTWEIDTQKLIEATQTSCYSWSPDGSKIAVGTQEGDVWIWNIQSNSFESNLKLLRSIRDLDWHPSSQFLSIGCDDATVLQWSPTTQKMRDVPLPHDDGVTFSRYCGEGDWLVSMDQSNVIRLWDIKSGLAEQQHQLVNQFDAHQVDVLVEFSPSDKQISAGAAAPASVWKTSDGTLLKTVTGSYLNWSFDGRFLASKFNETVTVWNAKSFEQHTTNEQLGYGLLRVWSPTDYRLSGNDSKGLWVWNVETNAVQRTAEAITEGGPDAFKAIAWSPDGKQIAVVANAYRLYIVDAETLECKHQFQPTTTTIRALAWSPDSKFLAVAAAQPSAIIVSVETGDIVKKLDAHSYEVRSVAWSKDGQRIATGGADRQLMVWNPDWELPVLSMEFDSEVRSVAWSHDNRILAGLSQNGQLRLWKASK
jgi:WD40 repeat protein